MYIVFTVRVIQLQRRKSPNTVWLFGRQQVTHWKGTSVCPALLPSGRLSNHPPVSPAVSLSIHVTVRPSVSQSELKIWAKKKVGGKEKKIHGNCPQRNTFPSQTLIQPWWVSSSLSLSMLLSSKPFSQWDNSRTLWAIKLIFCKMTFHDYLL